MPRSQHFPVFLAGLSLALFTLLVGCKTEMAPFKVQQESAEQGASSTPVSREAAAVAESMWNTISTRCSVKGSSSTFLRRSHLVGEYRDVRTYLYPWDLTKADEMNGITFEGMAVLRADARRYIEEGGEWKPWEGEPTWVKKQDFGRMFPEEMYSDFGWPARWIVVIERRDKQWFFTFPNRLGQKDRLEYKSLVNAGTGMTCTALTSANPFAVPGPKQQVD